MLVIGTTPFIGEGFDAPALDTLFLAAPDYHDRATPILAASLQRRMPGYRALGFTKT